MIIVVPSHSTPQVSAPPATTVRYTVVDPNGTCVYPPLYAQNMQTTSSPMIVTERNPIIDYYALYTHQDAKTVNIYNSWFPNSVNLQNHDLFNKVWEIRKVIDWINAKCDDVVLVQRATDASSWTIVFISPLEYASFMNWLATLKVTQYKVSLATPEREKEYEEWMRTNIKGRNRISISVIDGKKVAFVSVEDDNEEVLFKLRWFGVPDEGET